jgi:hypothetical protein
MKGFFRSLILSVLLLPVAHAHAGWHQDLEHSAKLLLSTPENTSLARGVEEQLKNFSRSRDAQDQESQRVLKVAAKSLAVARMAEAFRECLRSDRSKAFAQRVVDAASRSNALPDDPCRVLESGSVGQLARVGAAAGFEMEQAFESRLRKNTALNFARTALHWSARIQVPGRSTEHLLTPAELCARAGCSRQMREFLDSQLPIRPHAQDESLSLSLMTQKLNESAQTGGEQPEHSDDLLLLTDTLRESTRKIRDHLQRGRSPLGVPRLSETMVADARNEVLSQVRDQFAALTADDPQAAGVNVRRPRVQQGIDRLVRSSPAAVAELLVDQPAYIALVCESLQRIDLAVDREERWQKAHLWGGLIVGGVLLATGVGAIAGAAVMSGTAAASTLVTVASVTAVAGVGIGLGEAAYSGVRASQAVSDARTLRAGFYSGSGDRQTLDEAIARQDEAYGEMAASAINLASVIPFGAAWRSLSSASRLGVAGSAERAATLSGDGATRAMKGISETFRSIDTDPALKRVFERASKEVGSEPMGEFIGLLSTMPPSQRQVILEAMKRKPEQVSRTVRESLDEARRTCT